MPELTDDQLDGLFRKSTEEFDPPFDPAAWRDMKTRLDANDRNPAGGTPIWKNLLRWGLPLALLLLLSGGGWYAYRRVQPAVVSVRSREMPTASASLSRKGKTARPATAAPTTDRESDRTTTVGPKEFDAHAAKQPTDLVTSVAAPVRSSKRLDMPLTRSESNVTSSPEAATKRPALTYRSKMEQGRLDHSSFRAKASGGKSSFKSTSYGLRSTKLRKGKLTRNGHNRINGQYGTAFTELNRAPVLVSSFSKRRRATGQQLSSTNAVDGAGSVTSPATDETGLVTLPMLAYLTVRSAIWPKLPVALNRPITVQPDTTAHHVVSQLSSQRGLSIRVMVAPDLSTVGLKNFSRPGTNIGILLEYRLASRWSVQAGVLQSTKVYRALTSEYNFPYMWRVIPESVDGRCNVLDIPVNVRYDFALRPRMNGTLPGRWFVSGGVTTYVMKQEDYTFNYADPSNPHIYSNNWAASASTGAYGFSNLNVSVGYERAFSQRLSWQVEPFVKVPLKGVGLFNIDLLSTGVFFSLRYKLSK